MPLIEIEAEFTKGAGRLDRCADPSKPSFQQLAGPVDTHCHVLGTDEQFSDAPKQKYTSCPLKLKGRRPDDGLPVDFIPKIATTAGLRRSLLVDNPI